MKKSQTGYVRERAPFKEYLGIFKGIKMPWLFIALIFVAAIGSTFAGLSVSFFTGDMVDAQGDVPAAQLVSFAMGYLVMAACAAGSTVFQGIASERMNLGLRSKLWRKIIYTKQSCYDKDSGETLVSRVTTDCDFASKLLTTIVGFLSVAVGLVMYISQMYALNLTIANDIMLLVPVSVLIGWGYARLKFVIAQKTQAMLAGATTYLVERTRNLSMVKTSNTQEQEIREGKKRFQEQYIMQIKTGLMAAFYTSLQTLYNIVSIVIPFAVGANLVAKNILTAGDVIVFYGISSTVGGYFTNIIASVGEIRQANGALSRVINTMKLPDEQLEKGLEMDEPDADITFENVQFGYSEDAVLKQVTFRIPKHKVTAIVGSNGSGKTTIFKLTERLYEPNQGEIRFGNTDVKAYNLHAWRKTFGMVAQGSPLLEGTIRENICYGCEREVSDQELVKVAKETGVYEFVSELPDGFETLLAPGGQNFSGGQRQCIAIARAMMSSPDYLLLDEATSNLDAKSERAVIDGLDRLMQGRTTVIIAHSLAAIRHADYVVILKDGMVEATGSRDEILAKTDNYLARVMHRKCPKMV